MSDPRPNDTYSSFTGHGISVYRAAVLESSLRLYIASGGKITPTRGVGPKRMMALASEITGQTFKARDYERAAKELRMWIAVHKPLAVATGEIS